jgi:hypothetical protein
MSRQLLPGCKSKSCDIHILVLLQDIAQDSLFWDCEFLLQICKKFVIHGFSFVLALISEQVRCGAFGGELSVGAASIFKMQSEASTRCLALCPQIA